MLARLNMKNCKVSLDQILDFLIFLLCLTIFIVVLEPQVQDFMAGNKSTSRSLKPIGEAKYPLIVFCPKNASKGEVYDPDVNTSEYRKNAKVVNMSHGFMQRYLDDPLTYRPHILKEDLFTYYHGLCKAYIIEQKFPVNEILSFLVHEMTEQIVFYLRDYSEQIFLTYSVYFDSIATFQFDSSMLASVNKHKIKRLSTRNKPCLAAEDKSFERLSDCILRELKEKLLADGNVTCITPLLMKFVGEKERCENQKFAHECESWRNHEKVNIKAVEILGALKKDQVCVQPCINVSYKIHKTPLTFPKSNSGDKMTLVTSFLNGMVEVEEEFLIVSPMDLLTAVGGALGLFLGWSFYQNPLTL